MIARFSPSLVSMVTTVVLLSTGFMLPSLAAAGTDELATPSLSAAANPSAGSESSTATAASTSNTPSPKSSSSQSTNTNESAVFDDVQSKAFLQVMDGKYTEATQLVQDALKTEKEQSKRIRLIYLLSAIQRMDEDYSKAIANLQQVLEAQPKPTTPEQHFNHVVILKRIGDCYYGQRKTQPALQFYKSALAELDAVSADAQLTVPL